MRTRQNFNLHVNGLDTALNNLARLARQNQNEAKQAITETAINIERKAKLNLSQIPFKESVGGIAQSGGILYGNDGLSADVFFSKSYAPYIEYGTGTNVNIPPGFENYALQFKGQGIKQVNIKPMPYFHPAVNSELQNLHRKLLNSLRP